MSDLIVDTKTLSRKYRTSVTRLIRAWKQGQTDEELARRTGLSTATLSSIRGELELTHRRARLVKRMASEEAGMPGERHIFLRPLV